MKHKYKRTPEAVIADWELKRIGQIDKLVASYTELYREQKSLADNVKATRSDTERVKGGAADSDVIGKTIAALEELEAKINSKITEVIKLKIDALAVIEEIGDLTQQGLLIDRYINHKSIKHISADIDREREWVYKKINRALDNFYKIEQKRTNSN